MSQHDPRGQLVWLDFIRGVSAIAVCASHLRAATMVEFSQLQTPGIVGQLFYAVTGLGHQAVMVFFVMSGFFVGGSVLRGGSRFSPQRYLLARLARLWVVLLPALVLTAIADQWLTVFAPEVLTGAYKGTWNSGPVSAQDYSTSLPTLLGNLLFLQTVVTPVFGVNGPLWSLANEFWYYMMFPLLTVAAGWSIERPGERIGLRVAAGAVVVGLLAWLPVDIAVAFAIWLLGLVVYYSAGRLAPRAARWALFIGIAAFLLSLGYSRLGSLQARLGVPSDALIGLAFTLLCVGLVNRPQPAAGSLFARISARLSAFSYSLYLSHFPLVAVIGAGVYGAHPMTPTPGGLLIFAVWMAALMAVGQLFWWMFERRTDSVRRFVTGLWRQRRSS